LQPIDIISNLDIYSLRLIRILNDTTTIKNISFMANFLLKFPKIIIVFFISSIGPTTRKPITELTENCFKNPLAMNASEVEQTESTKDNNIIAIRGLILPLKIGMLVPADTIF
jgi:hypothetical protein